ncbi:type II secretion system protein GspG [Luteolibacter arcticus]|uniref:Type II secretion system protein GspG n=1 Tax=Luteolibacter arcticus TaxID=1581411 RepID=A0ABT3GPY6_9BACT|nr:type II secretion system protein GspG [Luteolibacter arcticus]MCW1925579.1 type II secretion system protein GspG [Luteolibacter arcticus]
MRVVGAFVLIAAMALVWFFTLGRPEGAKLARVERDDVVLSNAIGIYIINAGRPPSTEQGLMALVKEPVAGPKPRRWVQVMNKAPTDPWGWPYGYRIVAEGNRGWRYEIRSLGIDGKLQTGDDCASEFQVGTLTGK